MSLPSASLSVVTDEQLCREMWRRAVGQRENLSPFLAPAFQEGLAAIVPWRRVLIDAPDAALVSAFVRRRGPIRDLILPPFSPYSPILLFGEGQDDALRVLLKSNPDLPRTRLFSFPPGIDRAAFEGQDSVVVETRYTYHLSTAPLETAIQGWSSSQRRTFRKYRDEYVLSVGNPSDEASLSVFQDLVELTHSGYMRHDRRLPLKPSDLSQWAFELFRAGLGRLYSLRTKEGNRLEAGLLALHDASMAWYWLAGSVPGPAMTVLMALVQDDLHHAGIPTLDFMGANTPGISEFKRRFGGQKMAYTHVKTSSTAGDLAERAAKAAQRFRP